MRLIDLPWLVAPSRDFRQQVRSLLRLSVGSRAVARQLAVFRLSGNLLHVLGTVVDKLALEDSGATRLGVLSNSTTDLLLPAIAASALRHGVWVHTIGTAFDQVASEAFNSTSGINRSRCHYVLLAIDHRGLQFTSAPGDFGRARAMVDEALRYIELICQKLRDAAGCAVILQTVPQVPGSVFGSLERNIPGTLQWVIDCFNRELRERVRNSSDLLLDAAALAENVGLYQWHDPVHWFVGKFPFDHAVLPLYAEWVGRLIAAARGKSRKCLVLDLDNTLWGGVIGDDGLTGIELGNGSPAGEAFLRLQKTALTLRERGIVLTVSSKNDDQVARSPFLSHPEMLLKEEHIAVFQANWQDKASNLRAIAKTLNIGTDALVLLDDNPAERAQVREALPEVAVPELPEDPALYSETLLAAGYFEAIGFTTEDRTRADYYRANASRASLIETATDLESYLRSLKMRLICSPFDRVGRTRIAQLINKTNQFNLTTHRYTESEVEVFEKSALGLTLQLRLLDRFGDNGVIAVVICVEEGRDWLIDTWLMSCRVLNRKVEQATLNYIVYRAKTIGIRALSGRYVKTERNAIVKDHYASLGFAPIYNGDGESRWQLDVAAYTSVQVPIDIVDTAVVPDEEPALA